MSGRVVARVVLPFDPTPDVAPLYVDGDQWSTLGGARDEPLRVTDVNAVQYISGRRSLALPSFAAVSLGTYFNAFPAGYWRRWTPAREVTLRVRTKGDGELSVVRSNARGVLQTVESRVVSDHSTLEFTISLDYFLDGGWCWFDLAAGAGGLELVEADWLVATEEPTGKVAIAITTMNRTAYCLGMLSRLAQDEDVLHEIERVFVVDQGSDRIREAAGFDAVRYALGDRLTVIEQDNIGGAGGFARGMAESTALSAVSHVLLLDDDVQLEPESIMRALSFSRATTAPTIVGGHMFDMHDRSTLHAFSEAVGGATFDWGPVGPARHNFKHHNLRQTPWLHRRYDSDYNGWWMSLIPASVIERVGLPLPVFIKWDDAEYSLRAAREGIPTVSLPGAAVWHVSWVDKDDSNDWQAFYHARNRLVVALLHSDSRRGGRLPRRNFALDVRYLITSDYFTVAARHAAYESVLVGPAPLHGELRTRLGSIRELAKGFVETRVESDAAAIPNSSALAADALAAAAASEPGRGWMLRTAVALFARHLLRRPRAVTPTHVPYADSRWWVVGALDAAYVSNAQGAGVTLHRRDRAKFRSLLWRSIALNLTYRRRWAALRRQYREALPSIVSPASWAGTFRGDA